MSKIVEVTIIRHGFRDVGGVIHRSRIEVKQLIVDAGSRVIIPPVDMGSISHQRGGTTCKRRCPPPRSTNGIVRVGQCG